MSIPRFKGRKQPIEIREGENVNGTIRTKTKQQNNRGAKLRLAPTANKQEKLVRWAKDYEM